MTYRKHPLITEQIYHVFNRSIAKQPIFNNKKDYLRLINVINFYRFIKPSLKFSHYNRLARENRSMFLNELEKTEKQVLIFAFVLMPNHFHFLLKQTAENGIQKFIGNLQNSYSKYFNTKYRRTGSLFQEMFKNVAMEDDEEFVHVARYIHLNPYSSYLVKDINQLQEYSWSSFGNYLRGNTGYNFIDSDFLFSFFQSREKLSEFTLDQADYQRKLQDIKHLVFDHEQH